jgi:hypothetical protein
MTEYRHALVRRPSLRAVVFVAVWLAWRGDALQAQSGKAVEGVWSTPVTAPNHPEWTIDDYFCQRLCLAVAREHLRSLLADSRNNTRSLQELMREATRVGNQHRQRITTDAGAQRTRRYDPADDPAIRCEPPRLIELLQAPQPVVVEVHNDYVIMHHDHWNTVRKIMLGSGGAAVAVASTRLGSPTGRFEGATLVVESRNVAAFTNEAITMTDGTRIVERYTPGGNGARLDVEVTIEDPASYREPLVLSASRVRTPGEKIYDLPPCEFNSGQR